MNWKVKLPTGNRYGAETYEIEDHNIYPSKYDLKSYWFDPVKNSKVFIAYYLSKIRMIDNF